jgi:hypothetical protein
MIFVDFKKASKLLIYKTNSSCSLGKHGQLIVQDRDIKKVPDIGDIRMLHTDNEFSASLHWQAKLKKNTIHAFAHCDNLTTIKSNLRMKILPIYSFLNCSSLQEIDLPDTLIVIPDYYFYECTSFRVIKGNIPNLKVIDKCCFYECSSLVYFQIPC